MISRDVIAAIGSSDGKMHSSRKVVFSRKIVSVDVDLILFARSPDLGAVKTRMRPVLSAPQCQQLHKDMLEYCGAALSDWRWGRRLCWHTGMCDYWDDWQSRYGFELLQQSGPDLGQRMSAALRHSLNGSTAAIIVGADAVLGLHWLDAMAEVLSKQYRAVMLPAEDGGYLALGLPQYEAALFQDLPWGSAEVAAITRQRLACAELALSEWPACPDIDYPTDLARLAGSDLSNWARLAPD